MTESIQDACFTIMPFGDWHDHYYKHVYKAAIAEAGLKPVRADDLSRSSTIINDIWQYTKDASIVLADLSDTNPNVFYELGLAHALGKPVVLIASTIEEIPFDLRALRVLIYNKQDPDWGSILKSEIVKAIKEILASPTKSVLPTFLSVEDNPSAPVVTEYQKEILQLRSEFEIFKRQISNNSYKNNDVIVYEPTKLKRKHKEYYLNPNIDGIIKAGIRKGASQQSIEKRLLKMGVPDDIAWQLIHKYMDKTVE